jgi:hypothetical protein
MIDTIIHTRPLGWQEGKEVGREEESCVKTCFPLACHRRLLTSQNGPSGLGRTEAFWNSFSCDPSIAVLQSVPAFLLSRASVGPRSSGEVARQHASARSNQQFVEPFSLPEPILCRAPILPTHLRV